MGICHHVTYKCYQALSKAIKLSYNYYIFTPPKPHCVVSPAVTICLGCHNKVKIQNCPGYYVIYAMTYRSGFYVLTYRLGFYVLTYRFGFYVLMYRFGFFV